MHLQRELNEFVTLGADVVDILIIDDDPDTHDFLTPCLEAEGFDVHSAHSGTAGLEMLHQHDLDLVLVDIRLPQIDGWEVCRRIRAFSSIPMVIISAVAQDDDDVVRGLSIGADDYLTKPLRPNVLTARVRALLRRSADVRWRDERKVYVDPHLTVDLHRSQVHVEGQRAALTRLEYLLLETLVVHAGQIVPLLDIVEELWSDEIDIEYARYVRIYIKRLRSIIEPNPSDPKYIITHRGLGYSFQPQA